MDERFGHATAHRPRISYWGVLLFVLGAFLCAAEARAGTDRRGPRTPARVRHRSLPGRSGSGTASRGTRRPRPGRIPNRRPPPRLNTGGLRAHSPNRWPPRPGSGLALGYRCPRSNPTPTAASPPTDRRVPTARPGGYRQPPATDTRAPTDPGVGNCLESPPEPAPTQPTRSPPSEPPEPPPPRRAPTAHVEPMRSRQQSRSRPRAAHEPVPEPGPDRRDTVAEAGTEHLRWSPLPPHPPAPASLPSGHGQQRAADPTGSGPR